MNPGRGRPESPPEPPGSASLPIAEHGDGDEFSWDEENPFDRATLIPEIPPSEAALLGSPTVQASLAPTPVPTVPPLDDLDDDWDQPSAVIARTPSGPELELDLDDLGPPSAPFGHTPPPLRGPGKAKPISLLPPPPARLASPPPSVPRPTAAATAAARPISFSLGPSSAARPAPASSPRPSLASTPAVAPAAVPVSRPSAATTAPPPVSAPRPAQRPVSGTGTSRTTAPATPSALANPAPSLATPSALATPMVPAALATPVVPAPVPLSAESHARTTAVTRRDLSASIPRWVLEGTDPPEGEVEPGASNPAMPRASAPAAAGGGMPPTSTLGITPPGGMEAVEAPSSQPLRLPARGPLFQPPVVPEAARSEPLPPNPRPKSAPRQAMPTLHDEDPLSHDLQEVSRPQQRIHLPDELDDELDLSALRNPRMPAAPSSPARGASFEDDESPGTAPYLLVEEARSPAASTYVAGSLRQPAPVSAAPDTIHGLSEGGQDTLEDMGDLLTSARPTLMGHQPPPADPLQRALREMRDKFALGDFSGSLKAAEAVLASDPGHGEAQRYADTCRQRLRAMYEAKLGSLSRVPRVALPPDQVRWLSLDHRAGFILSCVDGYSAIEEILDVSGMSALDALRILCDLLQQKVIAVA